MFEEYVEAELVPEPEPVVPEEPLNNSNEVVELSPSPTQQPPLEAPPAAIPTHALPLIETLTIESRNTIHQQPPPTVVEQQPPPPPALEQGMNPESNIFYQQLPQQHPPPPQPPVQPQPPRPITEMLGTGSFFFLQVRNVLLMMNEKCHYKK